MANENVKEIKVTADSWYENYDQPQENKEGQLPIFEMKLQTGRLARTETVVFQTEGAKKTTRFGETIVFEIINAGVLKVWFIKKTQYNLLNPIAKERKVGSLIGRTAEVTRTGQGQKETKWGINFK